ERFSRFVSSSIGSKAVIGIWIVAILILALAAPGSSDVEESTDEGSAHGNEPSTIAQEMMDEEYPSDEGLVALLVYQDTEGISDNQRDDIKEMSEWLDSEEKPDNVASSLPFHKMPEKVQDKLFSEDGSTMQMNIAMKEGLDSDQLHDTLEKINNKAEEIGNNDLEMKITGPAGISADTVTLFKNADLVLLFSTIGLILVLLMIIYRSPLLAVIPLVVAGMVYMVVDRVIGIGGDNGWFVVDSQATSIMMILLFAVLTDYSLFVLSRYRTELKQVESKAEAMARAFGPVLKPILFSGITLHAAMIVLFFTDFKPYNHFAPVFSIAIVFILLGGITLIPALFTLAGRKAFWPFIPKVADKKSQATNKAGFWVKIGRTVTKRPGITAGIILLLMAAASVNLGSMKFSFNQLYSFPEDIDARQGYEMLADHFPEGELAQTNIVIKSDEELDVNEDFIEDVNDLQTSLQDDTRIEEAGPDLDKEMGKSEDSLPDDFLSNSDKAIKLDITLDGNPYSQSALNTIDELRDEEGSLLQEHGFEPDESSMYIAGQTAEQLDVRDMNERDMIVAFTAITSLMTIMLMFQSGSIRMGLIMIFTMLLSYTASLGLGWFIFENVLGYDAISYRLPLYTFVFLISLGVDYNIILVSRIR